MSHLGRTLANLGTLVLIVGVLIVSGWHLTVKMDEATRTAAYVYKSSGPFRRSVVQQMIKWDLIVGGIGVALIVVGRAVKDVKPSSNS